MIILLLCVLVIGVLLAKKTKKSAPKYVALPIMTPNELEFFARLTRALGADHHVFPQVAMSALIKPVDSFKDNKTAYWKINQKRVDFTVFTHAMSLVCIVELDDRLHVASKDQERDGWTSSAGIPTVRWQSNAKPSEQVIRQTILGLEARALRA